MTTVGNDASRRSALALAAVLMMSGCAAGNGSASAPTAALSQSRVPLSSSAAIWFHPEPSDADWPGQPPGRGSTDYRELFQPDAPWANAAAHTKVFGLYAGWVTAVPEQLLQHAVTFIKAHNMGIEIEAPALQATAKCGSGVEGYVPWGISLRNFTLDYLLRLKALGAPAPFIKVDEPYYFGSVVADPRACRWPVLQVAVDVAAYTRLVKAVYPNAVVGDVEPIIANAYSPDVVTAIGRWHDTYRAVTGAPFPFFFADVDYSNGAWPTIVRALEDGTRQRGMRFGIIYIGDWADKSDEEWAAKVVTRFEIYQGESGGRPDFVLFQSWEPHPKHCLPESDWTTCTGVIDSYVRATARSEHVVR